MKTIHIIGCGKVGKTLGRLWTELGVLQVRSVLNRSPQIARRAVDFLGAGRAIDGYRQMEPADLVMISTSDESIEGCCRELCRTEVLHPGTVVFHCSGSLSSELLAPARERGASIAGIHPVKSFADPAVAVKTFSGTFCAVEGDPAACEVLADCLHRCGANTFSVKPDQKTIYHAASVIVCNYLTALMEVGLRCYEKAGIPTDTAVRIIEPIARETLDNVFRLGPAEALTGPIARGEPSVVERQCEALGSWDEKIERVYKSLGQIAVQIAAAGGNVPDDALAAIEERMKRMGSGRD